MLEIPSLIVFIDIAFGIKVAGACSPIVGDSVQTQFWLLIKILHSFLKK